MSEGVWMADRGERRAAILRAGLEAVAELGYRHATTREICRRSGVSSGTFFHYFPTKADLLVALVAPDPGHQERSPLSDLLTEVVAEGSDPVLRAFVREVSTLTEVPGLDEALAREQDARRTRLERAVEAEREAGRADTTLALADQVLRVELLVEGYESLVATSTAGADDLEATLRALADLALGRGRGGRRTDGTA